LYKISSCGRSWGKPSFSNGLTMADDAAAADDDERCNGSFGI